MLRREQDFRYWKEIDQVNAEMGSLSK
jgi:hypothetical protein